MHYAHQNSKPFKNHKVFQLCSHSRWHSTAARIQLVLESLQALTLLTTASIVITHLFTLRILTFLDDGPYLTRPKTQPDPTRPVNPTHRRTQPDPYLWSVVGLTWVGRGRRKVVLGRRRRLLLMTKSKTAERWRNVTRQCCHQVSRLLAIDSPNRPTSAGPSPELPARPAV